MSPSRDDVGLRRCAPRWVLLVACTSLALAGCTGSPSKVPASTAAGAAASASASTGAHPPRPSGSPAALPALAAQTATLPKDRGTVDVVVRSLVLDPNGTTMTLRVAFTAHLTPTPNPPSFSLSAMNGSFFVHPVLLDRVNLKQYLVLEGDGSQKWLSNQDARTTNDVPLESWFVFAAPEDTLTSIDVTIDAWNISLPDVPVTS